jgi:two-component system LytT family response regulator
MKTLKIHIGGRKEVLPNEVILFEADVNYTKLYLRNGQNILVATTLKKLEQRFSSFDFIFRIHKGFMINLNDIKRINFDTVLLKNKREILVSRRRKETLLKNVVNLDSNKKNVKSTFR